MTNSAGVATVGSWTLGPTPGTRNSLLVTVGTLTTTFVATTTGTDPCTSATPYTFTATTSGQLTSSDCLAGGYHTDFWSTSVPAAGAYLFRESSTTMDAYLILYDAAGVPLAVNDDDFFGSPSTDSRIKMLMPAISVLLGAGAFGAQETGSYTISSSTTTASIEQCEDVFAVRGISSAQTLTTTDCSNGGFYSDDVYIYLTAGQSVTASMSSTDFDPYLEIYSLSGSGAVLVAANDNKDTTTTDAQASYTAQTSGFFLIAPTTKLSAVVGAYTLGVQ
jgi:hypothetical protein